MVSTNKNIALIGCTGLVGQALCRQLLAEGYALRVLVRSQAPAWLDELQAQHGTVTCLQWDGGAEPIPLEHFSGCQAVVNLAGAPVAEGRWTAKRKQSVAR